MTVLLVATLSGCGRALVVASLFCWVARRFLETETAVVTGSEAAFMTGGGMFCLTTGAAAVTCRTLIRLFSRAEPDWALA
ncbi:hypothetical protein GCM10027295_12470 [Pseudaeromonas pectinilytica]